MSVTTPEHLDVVIVGAGLSGIGAAWHVQDRLPGKSYALLEQRERSGGTWDLFRYPGVRSDSDMYTLGYRFKPWTSKKAIADGDDILGYVRETAREAGIDRKIRYQQKLVHMSWSSEDARWTLDIDRGDAGGREQLTASFVLMCSGYYDYEKGYAPEFPGIEAFGGETVHPQHWPEGFDYAGKRVVVIGSGATAVTLVPAMAPEAEHVTMLQRSPTYIVTMPGVDPIATALDRLPKKLSYPVLRWKNVAQMTISYQLARRAPKRMRGILRELSIRQLPKGYDVDTHFKPRYDPWDQRLCLVPDGDLFKALRKDDAEIVTDTIERFDATGIQLTSGRHLDADVVVTATGLNLLAFGGTTFSVDGQEVSLPDTMAYKGLMLTHLPNFVYTVGYTNISWTLKADLVSEYAVRLMKHMDAKGYDSAVPEGDASVEPEPFLDFAAGYVMRSVDRFPKQGSKKPWRLNMNYTLDLPTLRHGSVENGMRFGKRRAPASGTPAVDERAPVSV